MVNLGVRENVETYMKKNGLTFPVVYDNDNTVSKIFDAKILTNILIDRNGKIVFDDRELPGDKYFNEILK